MYLVALLAEGVDRNREFAKGFEKLSESPSSRRAWIEIILAAAFSNLEHVALLAEGVDRNREDYGISANAPSRPPRGGRG